MKHLVVEPDIAPRGFFFNLRRGGMNGDPHHVSSQHPAFERNDVEGVTADCPNPGQHEKFHVGFYRGLKTSGIC